MKPKRYQLANLSSRLPLATLFIAVSLSALPASAADLTWDGSSGTYNTPASWSGGAVPGTGDKAFINGGSVTMGTADPDWTINGGLSLGGTGAFAQSDKVLSTTGEIWIGQGTGSTASYTLSGGTLNVSNWLAVGRASGNGTLNITGGILNKNAGGNFVIASGQNAAGTIEHSGGTLNNTASETWLTESSNLPGGSGNGSGVGIYNLSGSAQANLGILYLTRSGNGSGTFNLNGGTLAVSRIGKHGDGGAANGVFNFNGGTLRARQNEGNFLAGINAANIKAGGAVIDSNGFAITIAQNLLSDATGGADTLIKRGLGALTLSGTNTFAGTITVEQGALVGRKTASLPGWNVANHITVQSGGALGGTLGGSGGGDTMSQADFETLLSSANMLAGSSVAIDTSNGSHTYATDIAALPTGLGTAVGLHKTGGNDLTINMDGQTFTGAIATHGGRLFLSNSTDRTYSAPFSGAGNLTLSGNGNKTVTSFSTNIGSFNLEGTGTLNLPSSGLTTNGNFVTNGGQVRLNGGTLTVGGETQIGQGAGVNSTITVAAGDAVVANSWFTIGRGGGTGTLEFTGGTITKQGNNNSMVGARDGGASTGIVNQTGGDLNVVTGEFWIGQNGNDNSTPANKATGTYNLSNGTVTLNNWLAIGREGGNGTLNISGGTFTKQGANHIEIGGTGTNGSTGLINQIGGTFNALTGETRIGLSAAGSGTYTISGGNANLGIVKLSHANNGKATINLNGGTMTVQKIEKTTAGNGAVNFNGGVLRAKDTEAAFLNGITAANVQAGGARIDSNGFNITVGQALVGSAGDGGLTKIGNGILTLSGTNTYTGATQIQGGTLALAPSGSINTSTSINVGAGATFDVSSSGMTLLPTQTLSGSGTVVGGMSIAGTLSPGSSPGTLSTGDQSWENGGNYNFQMQNAGGTAGTAWDLVAISGVLDLSGLDANGFNINLWTLFSSGPDVNGNAAGFDAAQNYSWNIATATGGISGFDADDFVINVGAANGAGGWSNPINGGEFTVTTSGNNLVLNFTAVPEPSSMLLIGLSGLALTMRRRRNA